MFLTNNVFDRVVYLLVIALAVLPFGQLLILRLPGIALNSFELIWILLAGLLVLRILFTLRVRFAIPLLVFSCVVSLTLLISIAFYGISVKDSLVQLRIYMPFIVALLIYSAGTTIHIRHWVNGLVLATLFSASSALIIHHLLPGVILWSFSAEGDAHSLILEHGRLHWINVSLAFIALLVAFCPDLKTRKIVLGMAVVISFLAMFNTLNRTVLVGYFLFLGLTIFRTTNIKTFLKTAGIQIVVVMAAVVVAFTLSLFDERVAALIQTRVIGLGASVDVGGNASVLERLLIYTQYRESIVQHFPLGQGLGKPLFDSVITGPVYTTDVSIMAFLLPFGVGGVIAFGVYIIQTVSIIGSLKKAYSRATIVALYIFFGVFLLMSLNIDFFSRNNVVIYFAALLSALHYSRLKSMRPVKPPDTMQILRTERLEQ